jgi:hypothetical protein
METIETWWKGQKRWWRKKTSKVSHKTKAAVDSFTSIFEFSLPPFFSLSTSSTAEDNVGSSVSSQSSSPLKVLFGYGGDTAEDVAPEPAKKHPVLNRIDIASALVTYFPDTAIIALCREDGSICVSENYAVGGLPGDELRRLVRAVNVGKTEEARDQAIKDGLQFAGKRFEVFQYHPPLVYGRTAAPKQPIKDGWGIAVVQHEVSGNHTCILRRDSHEERRDAESENEAWNVEQEGMGGSKMAYLVVAYPLPHTSAYILSQAQIFCSKFL